MWVTHESRVNIFVSHKCGYFMTFPWCLQVDHCTSGLGFSFGPKNCGWFSLQNTVPLSRNPSASVGSVWIFTLELVSCQRNVTFPKSSCFDLLLLEALTLRQRFETRRATRNDDVSNKSALSITEGMSQLEIITVTPLTDVHISISFILWSCGPRGKLTASIRSTSVVDWPGLMRKTA